MIPIQKSSTPYPLLTSSTIPLYHLAEPVNIFLVYTYLIMEKRVLIPIIKNSTETNMLQGDLKVVVKNLIDLHKEKEYNKHQPTLD